MSIFRDRRLWWLSIIAIILAAIWWGGPRVTPLPPALTTAPPPPALITDRHGKILRHPLDPSSSTRSSAATEAPPEILIHCILAAEDKRFFDHDGMDLAATVRAMGQFLTHRRPVSGASTITQQWVKLRLHRDQPRTAGRKWTEIWLARAAETRIPKATILAAYLDEVDLGNLNRGMVQAARDYFGKPLADLSLAESATLAGLPQAPSRLNPRRYPDRAITRRNTVLDRLAAMQVVSADAIATARTEPLVVRPPQSAFLAPHFADLLAATAPGGTVRATLDHDLQVVAASRLRQHLNRLATHNVTQGAIIVLDNPGGGVLAMVGSSDFATSPAGQVNHAFAPRSPGSTLKPFTYLLAFEAGYGPWSLLADVPTAYPSATGPFRPENYDRRFRGPVTARAALANSLNIPVVRLLNDCGGPQALATMLRQCGFAPLANPAAAYGLGLTIGNAECSLWDLAVGYATLAKGGTLMVPTMSMDTPPPPPVQAVSPAAAWLVGDILRDNAARSGTFSLNSPMRLPWPVAAKTGTSTDFRDNWTIGYTPDFTVAVWVGNSDGSPMQHISGVTGAAPVFRDIMLHLHRGHPPVWPGPPAGIIDVTIDPRGGYRVAPNHPRATRDYALANHLPPRDGPATTTADGKILLPEEFRAWLNSPENPHPGWFALGATAPSHATPRILFPTEGTTVRLDPALPDSGANLTLESDLDDTTLITWSSPTLAIQPGPNGRPRAVLTPGRHTLTATHPANGRSATTWIEVKER